MKIIKYVVIKLILFFFLQLWLFILHIWDFNAPFPQLEVELPHPYLSLFHRLSYPSERS